MNSNEMKVEENVFKTSCGFTDTRHKLNLKNEVVPEEVLARIEAGCPLELLDEISKTYPICKYATQITIHGLFPQIHTHRIGGEYHNLIRNKNQSIGVRWDAIDSEKKSRLYKRCRICTGLHIIHNSTSWHLQKIVPLTRDDAGKKILEDLKAEAARIEKGKELFYGGACVWVGSLFGSLFAVYDVTVQGFYERNFDAIVRLITGMTDEEIAEKVAEHEAKMAARDKEMEERHRAFEEKLAKDKEEATAFNQKFLEENPAPYPMKKNHTLAVGEIIAKLTDDRNYPPKYTGWQHYVVRKSFGKLTITPCDSNGVIATTSWGGKAKGREVKPMGDYYVKPGKEAA